MKKYLVLVSTCFLLSCAATKNYDVVTDDAGNPHYTKKLKDDTKGQNYFPETRQVDGKKVFVFDPNLDAWAAYAANGHRLMTGSASGGRDVCPNDAKKSCRTVIGTFHVYDKKGPDCKSSEYPLSTHGGAKMPYCMHFFEGYAIHAAYDVPDYNASHGCIRVLPGAAKWLNERFIDIGTTVVVMPYNHPDKLPLA